MVSYTSKTLIPGRPGTVKWVKKYGEALIYVRYRYDVLNKRKIKTVELIVEDGMEVKEKYPVIKLLK